MRSKYLAQVVAFAIAISLSSCENKKTDAPGAETTTQSETSTTNTTIQPTPRATGDVAPSASAPYKRYAMDRAHIHYEVSGFRRGVEDLYFENWGKKEARYINVENITEKGVRPDKTVIVTNGSHMMIANLSGGQGTEMTEPSVDSMMRSPNVDSPEAISDSILSKMHYVRQGQETVLGKTTNVWFEQSTGTKLFTWKGIVLKQEVKNPQHQHTVIATSIDTTMDIPDSIFIAPSTVQYMPVPSRPGR
jgi:hypothetical protein